MIPVRGSAPRTRFPLVTLGLIALNAWGFLHELSLPPGDLQGVLLRWGLVPALHLHALTEAPAALDLWLAPVFTSMFLHGGWGHLVGNMLFLWVFGHGVESRLGHARFAAFYLLAGVAAAQAQVWLNPDSLLPMVGASGAIAGVLGAYLLAFPRSSVTLLVPIFIFPLFFDVPAFLFLLLWYLQQVLGGAAGVLSGAAEAGGVAWWAHVGGFLGGLALLPLFDRSRPPPPPRRLRARRADRLSW